MAGSVKDESKPTGDQVENLRDNLLPAPAGEDPLKPRMPFKTAYVLTREQEDELVEFACKRIEQIEDQLGRKIQSEGTGKGQVVLQKTIANPNSFMGKREKFTLRYYNHVEDRQVRDTIYEQSNLTASLSQRITMQMVAAGINFFFGQPDDTDWFSTSAVGAEDETLSDSVKKHSRWKVDQCGVKHRFIEALEFAFVRGEAVIKVTHQDRGQIYKRTATILMDAQDNPILDANGDYIVQGDSFVDKMGPPDPTIFQKIKTFLTGPEPGAVDQSGQMGAAPQLVPTGEKVLKRDGVTVLPKVPVWKEQVITRRLVTFEGPDAQLVYYKDFLCAETASDVQTADLIAHLYDMNVMKVAEMFRGQYGEGDSAIEDMKAAVERLRDMLGESNLPKAAEGQPRSDFKMTDTAGPAGLPTAEIAETYLTYDADGDGIQEEIMLVLDKKRKAPIYYEYLANVTVRGLRPFYVWRPQGVDGFWWGIGSMELFDPEQEFIDLQVNRHNFATSKSGTITFWDAQGTVEGNRDPNLKLGHGKTYTLRDGKKAEEVLAFKQLPTDQENLQYLIDLFMQLMQLKSGKINPGDQKMAGLPSSETATGENLVNQSGDELFSRILSVLYPGVKSALQAVIEVIYANMNRVEVFNYFNGEADEILQLDPDAVRDLTMNVTLELSRKQQQRVFEEGDKALNLINWFYGLPLVIQQNAAGFVRQRLKGLGVSQSDKLIQPIDTGVGHPANTDKPSSVAQALAALMKAGTPIGVDDVNGVLQNMGLPPLQQGPPAAPPPAPGDSETQSEPPQSAV